MGLLRGREIKDDIAVIAGGESFDGWGNISVNKSLESIANSFSVEVFDKYKGLRENWPLKSGVPIEISIGRERVFTGNIEVTNPEFGQERRSLIVSGRSKAGDLVDCHHQGPYEYKNILLTDMAKQLVSPFGIRVFESVVPSIIEKFAVKPNETIFEALDRAARDQGFMFISTRGGNIRLTRAARARSFSSLEQGVNIVGAAATYDDSKRHDNYIVKGQTSGLEEFFGESVAQAQGTAKDLGVKRHRPLVMVAESSVDSAKAKTRAEWEASSRLAKATRVTVSVRGWTQGNGSLWGINQITPVRSSFLGIDRDLLSVDVTHIDSTNNGKVTNIVLTDPQAYSPEPEKNKKAKDDIFAQLGAGFLK